MAPPPPWCLLVVEEGRQILTSDGKRLLDRGAELLMEPAELLSTASGGKKGLLVGSCSRLTPPPFQACRLALALLAGETNR